MDELRRQLSARDMALLFERLQSLEGEVVAAAVFGSAARGELRADTSLWAYRNSKPFPRSVLIFALGTVGLQRNYCVSGCT